jgi:hypothetical protein
MHHIFHLRKASGCFLSRRLFLEFPAHGQVARYLFSAALLQFLDRLIFHHESYIFEFYLGASLADHIAACFVLIWLYSARI